MKDRFSNAAPNTLFTCEGQLQLNRYCDDPNVLDDSGSSGPSFSKRVVSSYVDGYPFTSCRSPGVLFPSKTWIDFKGNWTSAFKWMLE